MRNTAKVNELAQIIWDYHHLNHKLKKSSAILVLGSHDLRIADWAVELFKKNYAPWLIFSGGIAHQEDLLRTGWEKSEAEMMADKALAAGIPAENIIIENLSTNTGDNFRFTKAILEKRGLDFKSFILVQKPYMERRAWATFKLEWPDKKAVVSSPSLTFEEYCTNEFPKEKVIHIMIGDLQRIMLYSKLGYQTPQRVPCKVMKAYKELIALGFNKHLLKKHK